uniref:DNA replication factor Cdt1 C-terminal domain-containing protein n=1 Tax=Tetranychus urticae TaxID=32264 RepID=T1L5J1_TETUR
MLPSVFKAMKDATSITTPSKTPSKTSLKTALKTPFKTPSTTPSKTPSKTPTRPSKSSSSLSSKKLRTPKSTTTTKSKRKNDLDIIAKCKTIDSYFQRKVKQPTKLEPKKLSKFFDDVARIEEGPLKGLPTSLLDKIKPKKPDDGQAERKKLLQKLPELLKIVHLYFLTNPKPIQLGILIEKCISSYYTYISVPDAEKQMRLTCELFPEWLTIISIRKVEFVKYVDRKYL